MGWKKAGRKGGRKRGRLEDKDARVREGKITLQREKTVYAGKK